MTLMRPKSCLQRNQLLAERQLQRSVAAVDAQSWWENCHWVIDAMLIEEFGHLTIEGALKRYPCMKE